MKFKLIVAMVQDGRTDAVTDAARASGATGCTVITNARGEGLKPSSTFMGLTLEGLRDVILLLVEEHRSRSVLEAVSKAGKFEDVNGAGVAFQIDIEDAIGLHSQIREISRDYEEEEL